MDLEIYRNGDEIIVIEFGRPATRYHADTQVQVHEETMGLHPGFYRLGDLSNWHVEAYHMGFLDLPNFGE